MERMDFLLSNHKRFRTTELGNRTYKIAAKFSLGTLHFTGGFGMPINVQMSIDEMSSSSPTVNVKSKIRVEHYFMIFVFGFMLTINTVTGNQPWYLPLYSLGLFIICHFWFHMVYRVQENELINKLKGQLKLIEKSESNRR